jgi:hypothetical protein
LEHKKNNVPFLFQESSGSYQVNSTGGLEKYGLVNPGDPTERTGTALNSKFGRDHMIGSVPWKASQQTRGPLTCRPLSAGHSLCHRRTPKAAFRRRTGQAVRVLVSMGVQLPAQRQQHGAGQKDRG